MKRDGFTIIEVIIFLAISGLMLVMAMVGSTNLARQTRFSDTVNSLQSMIQRQYEQVANGVNTREDTEQGCKGGSPRPGTDACVLIGKVISFNHNAGTTVYIRYVTDNPPYTLSGIITDQIRLADPTVSTSGQETYDLAWGAEFQTASRLTPVSPADLATLVKPGSSRALINNIAFLRSPAGSQIVPYYFYSDTTAANSVETNLTQAVADPNNTTGTEAFVCITNKKEWTAASAPAAALWLGKGQGSVAIDTKFSPTRSNTAIAECNL